MLSDEGPTSCMPEYPTFPARAGSGLGFRVQGLGRLPGLTFLVLLFEDGSHVFRDLYEGSILSEAPN